jgi:hypothetical protein
MATAVEYEQKIKSLFHEGLNDLWDKCVNNTYDKTFWNEGKLLEYIVLRGFELELDGCVTYPFDVDDNDVNYGGPIEQIDGAVHVGELHALVECKDYSIATIKVEPLAKMRNQLARRHGIMFGMFFTTTNVSTPAQIQVKFMAPQLIIIWGKRDIDYCIKNRCFIPCMRAKYRMAVEKCVYNYEFYMHDVDFKNYAGDPLF